MSDTHNTMKDGAEKSEVAKREEEVLAFWQERDIFNKSVAKDAPHGDFVFYDGPPFATGLPHYGHILAGTIKDSIPRFWTMNGYRVRRKWGWDCHGLPLENIIEKRLGLATKRDIEALGVKKFNEAARGAVLEYADDWKHIVPRMGRWVDMEHDYKTMDASYTESVWWVFSELNKKGLVYEGFKSMHLCPRCGTTLSNFEVNLGYKDIKDIAVTVKLPLIDEPDTSLLVWTTTPWTLPGNMAAAVHNDIEYAKVRVKTEDGEDVVILAKDRLVQLGTEDYEVLDVMKGSELVGQSYIPPFDYFKDREFKDKEKAWKIYHADYVELGDEGTGAVHLAPAYGEDDMNLAKEHNLPIVHHVDTDGRFMDFIADFKGELVKPKDDEATEISHLDMDIEIVKALKETGRLFRKENITHSYPHCWRCDTPLLNYATTSWFVRVTEIKDELVSENSKVHWVPEHVGAARFGKWLEGARDWAISRQRYWGAPLPIWRNPETKEYKVFGSLKQLQDYVPKSGNKYFMMRHGEAEHNVNNIMSSSADDPYRLTEKGRQQVKDAIGKLKKERIDYIFTSPLIRAKETAEMIAEALGIPPSAVISEERIHENLGGIFEKKSIEEWHEYRSRLTDEEKITHAFEGGESWQDIQKRMVNVLFEIEGKYKNKNILFVSHGMPLQLMKWGAELASRTEMIRQWEEEAHFGTGAINTIDFAPFPHNDNYELDFHRPYIDEIELYDGETKLERVPDVFDCWFESGSMPYGQQHYPFENTDVFEPKKGKGYPAQFIAEGLDQTRGWFYSLIVLGTAIFGKSPYENVIVNGLVLAEDGKKMSKYLQNYPDPMDLADRVGVDAMRFYLLSSPVIRGEDLNFSEKEVLELQRKNIGRLHNVIAMYEMYAPVRADAASATSNGAGDEVKTSDTSKHVLDRWIIARLNEITEEITAGFKSYELDRATRPVTDFIDDLSVWYLRRSRDRLKAGNNEDKKLTLATLRYVLRTLALLMAPSMPFYAEYLWSRVKESNDEESVHLAAWPKTGKVDVDAIAEMQQARQIVTAALEARTRANIKIRQPLRTLFVKRHITKDAEPYLALVRDEVNVKEIISDMDMDEAVRLDTLITPELQMEGDARELMRGIQDMRKRLGLEPQDRIALVIQTSDGGEAVVRAFESGIKATVGAEVIEFGDARGEEIQAGEHSFTVEVRKQ
jgi:isoleucyl-tRNA synthetase